MKMIVGLGNPGARYANTRHNAGFMVVDRLVRRHAPDAPVRNRFHADTVEASIAGDRCLLIRPVTYMNLSGRPVVETLRFYKVPIQDLLVISDDTALPLGSIRLRGSGSAGGHNGLGDIETHLATQCYARLRLGVGERPVLMDQADWVTSRFTPEEVDALAPALDRAADAAECWASRGLETAMNRFNTRAERPNPPGSAPASPPPRPNA